MRAKKSLLIHAITIFAVMSCQKNQPIERIKQVSAETLIDLVGPISSMVTTVYLSDTSGTPIQNALVIVNRDTLREIEPGTYRIAHFEFFPIPDTFTLSVNDEDDAFSITVLPPDPLIVEIVSPPNLDTLPSGEPLHLIWRPCNQVSYYEVQVVDTIDTPKYQILTEDTTVLVPDSVLAGSPSVGIKVWAVAGPSLKNGTPTHNINQNKWMGTYAIKALGSILVYIRENP